MNLLLLYPDEIAGGIATLRGARAQAVTKQHELVAGLTLKAGVLGGNLGHATVSRIHDQDLTLTLQLDQTPPARLPLVVVVGIARPHTVRKVLMTAVSFGVRSLHLVRSENAEKSYFDADILKPAVLNAEIDLALEQAVDTVRPEVVIHRKFKESLAHLQATPGFAEARKIIGSTRVQPQTGIEFGQAGLTVLCIGPEAGWSDFEQTQFLSLGFRPFTMGERQLRVETAVAALLGRFSV